MFIALALISALLAKHYVADFVLQPQWMLKGKGDLRAPGGYAHAAFHALCSGIVLGVFGFGFTVIAVLMFAEFIVHYAIDFTKDRMSTKTTVQESPHLYWQLHGLDQLLHQLTYVAMTYFALVTVIV